MVPVKVYLDLSSNRDEALLNSTFHATKMAGGSLLGSARFISYY